VTELLEKVTRPRRTLLGPLGAFAMLVALGGCSSGTSSPPAPVEATGSVHCGSITGSVDFSPALTSSGNVAETTDVTVHLSDCATSDSNISKVSSGVATTSLKGGTNSCAGLATSKALTVNTTWEPSGIKPSVVSFSGFSVATDSQGNSGFELPGSGHTVKVVGSFAGNDGGATSSASIYADMGATALLSGCTQPSGLASITVASGQVTLK